MDFKNKQIAKTGLEHDVTSWRKAYCYLSNNPKIVKFVKRKMNKKFRKDNRLAIKTNKEY